MRVNQNIAVSLTERVLLVPYETSHVETYHEWMKDPTIQKETASEPLPLDSEHLMQQSWRSDPDKLTFIICKPRTNSKEIITGVDDAPARMLGDVNLFLSPSDEGNGLVGEIEIMIAPTEQRRMGYGRSALISFLHYISTNREAILDEYRSSLGTTPKSRKEIQLKVKIGEDNVKSITLFESLGFRKVREEANYFGEFELVLGCEFCVSWTRRLIGEAGYTELTYMP